MLWQRLGLRPCREAAACLDAEAPGAGVLVCDEVLGHSDEVGEGVLLLQELAILVPLAAHVAAAADVRNGVREAAVDQAQLVAVEPGVVRHLIRPIPAVNHPYGELRIQDWCACLSSEQRIVAPWIHTSATQVLRGPSPCGQIAKL